ncbi:MAG: DNA-protecting protein DprA [bacterium]|nr:DNA-protecting protein DprA [bacterium]
MDPRELLIALNSTEKTSRAALCRLAGVLEHWRHLRPAEATARRAAALGVPLRQLRRALEQVARAPELLECELRLAARLGCRHLTRLDPDYPSALLDLALPPPVLYCRGKLPTGPAVAIVGSRKMDGYGEDAARLFGRQLAAAGVTVVSGFARGVDTVAHRAALDAGGETVAVLGCGVDVDYPRGNARLAAEIAASGAVVSEFPPGAEPRAWRFPVRNRVIAALGVGTLVVQATLKSGSLITAHHALELGRDVYAVPGRIVDPRSRGTNGLIADGALMAREPRDVLESLSIGVQQQLFPASETVPEPEPVAAEPEREPPAGTAGKVVAALSPVSGRTVEEIAGRVGAAVDQILGALLELELAGWVRREPGPVYLRC